MFQSLGWEDPGEGNGYPLQYSCLENSMDRGAWWATIHWVCKESDTKEYTHTHTHTRTVNHRVNVTACQMIKTITQEVGRTQEGTQTVTKQYNCTIDECLNHTEGGGKKGGDLSHPGRGF